MSRLAVIALIGCVSLSAPALAQSDAAISAQTAYEMAARLEAGDGVLQNYAKAREWFEKSAQMGLPAAKNALARYLFDGLGGPQDIPRALTLFAAAAQTGQAAFQYEYATALETRGDGRADPALAAEFYTKAADQGHLDAMASLGVLYQNGIGVTKDLDRARTLYEGPAAQGNARAQNNLGLLYVRGEGVEQDYGKAAALFAAAAEQGLKVAMTNLGVMYENGFGVPLDEARSAELYRLGGRGNEDAATSDFPAYDDRLLPLQVTDESTRALMRSAAGGDPVAQFQLAWLILSQPQTTPDQTRQAVSMMMASANSGYAPAMANMGWLYASGRGVPQDYVLAQMWLVLASSSGFDPARSLNADLSRRMTSDQISEAQAMAAVKRGQK
ncbi:sel1 repeat family protein [Thalassobius vesicularis]|uniref:Sel1 repeat family protein n=1 Tax=Thalassobius vesicularis TaxID=1294297 RepID=A0A4S3MF55_9RHOB|nr:tetratricopeptide repeat protein [Thalassobius vesicularis]THD76788.1 sel1 repeat family protein [Thalassobius vesicularis]